MSDKQKQQKIIYFSVYSVAQFRENQKKRKERNNSAEGHMISIYAQHEFSRIVWVAKRARGVLKQKIYLTSIYDRIVSIFWLMPLCPSPHTRTRVSVPIVNMCKAKNYLDVSQCDGCEQNKIKTKKKKFRWPTSKQISSRLKYSLILKSDITIARLPLGVVLVCASFFRFSAYHVADYEIKW